ncbi:hypothetical protein BKA69DRAFT_1121571 [Paraphysoderma sedebokerense]|nr:hypothetical protein BKA69DRAFT_1121571 [Paraphysoderma sedebokerense]
MVGIPPQELHDNIRRSLSSGKKNIIFVTKPNVQLQNPDLPRECWQSENGLLVFVSGSQNNNDYSGKSVNIRGKTIPLDVRSASDEDIITLRDKHQTESSRTIQQYCGAIRRIVKGGTELPALQSVLNVISYLDKKSRPRRGGPSQFLQPPGRTIPAMSLLKIEDYEVYKSYITIGNELGECFEYCKAQLQDDDGWRPTREIEDALSHLITFFDFVHETRHFRDSEAHFFQWRYSSPQFRAAPIRIYSTYSPCMICQSLITNLIRRFNHLGVEFVFFNKYGASCCGQGDPSTDCIPIGELSPFLPVEQSSYSYLYSGVSRRCRDLM